MPVYVREAASMDAPAMDRYRLVVLGAGKVGKTSIIKRYLFNTFPEKYRETTEDLFTREFKIHGCILPLDVLDTSFHFPDMRRLWISSANAFLIVFSVDNVVSFKDASDLITEIISRRNDLSGVPIMIVGNKADLPAKKINAETAKAWISRLNTGGQVRYLEVSAQSGENIVQIFQNFLEMSGFPHSMKTNISNANLLTPTPARSRSFRRRPSSAKPADTDDTKSKDNSTANNKNEKQKLTRHGSLMRKTQRLSLKIKNLPQEERKDESDCKIS